MNTQPAQPIRVAASTRPSHATVPINARQLAHIAELLDILDGFLRRADGIADRLADYLHATGRDRPQPPLGRLECEPAHRPGQRHRPQPVRPLPRTATVSTRYR
jgi:hypothetical protein